MSKIEVNTVAPQCGTTLTLGESGDTVTLGSGASQSGFGRTGTVDWQTTVKTGDFTAVNGEGYFINTTSGAITMTLPSSPSAGDIVAIKDYANTFDTNNLTINRNGQPVSGDTVNPIISTEGQALTLVYGDATKGWQSVAASTESDLPKAAYVAATGGTITCCGDFKIHTFTGPGTFTISCAGNTQGSNSIQYLVVAAGGGGGHDNGGGGGGGSVVTASADTGITAQAYPITVGAGGAGGPGSPTNNDPGVSGSPTTFFSITALRGGGGRTSCGGTAATPVGNGGGGAGVSSSNIGCSGTSSSPTIPASATSFDANGGGNGTNGTGSVFRSGGGGGAGGAGNSGAPGPVSSHGGDGTPNNICGTTYFYGGGGGGGVFCGSAGDGGQGGSGGGGGGNCTPSPAGAAGANGRNAGSAGSTHPSGAGGNAGANTGSGGGGAGRDSSNQGGNGGSGIVIIKYKFRN